MTSTSFLIKAGEMLNNAVTPERKYILLQGSKCGSNSLKQITLSMIGIEIVHTCCDFREFKCTQFILYNCLRLRTLLDLTVFHQSLLNPATNYGSEC